MDISIIGVCVCVCVCVNLMMVIIALFCVLQEDTEKPLSYGQEFSTALKIKCMTQMDS